MSSLPTLPIGSDYRTGRLIPTTMGNPQPLYNPYFWGSKPSFLVVLGSEGTLPHKNQPFTNSKLTP